MIDEELKNNSSVSSLPELYEPVCYMLSLGGKRMRPVLTLLACEMFGGKTEDALPAAIGIELFHNFTLMHDDIMDKAPLRRNNETVFKKWNENIAILSGDVLLVRAYQNISKTKNEKLKQILEIFSKTAVKVCEGQQLDMNYEKQNIGIEQYLKMIEMKTAVLLAASLKIGAVIGNAGKKDSENIFEFGKNTGLAFQLRDDLLDVYGEEKKTGKQKGGDIIANKKTFLFLKAIEKADRYKKEELLNWTQSADAKEKVEAVKAIYDFLDIKSETEKVIKNYSEKAFSHLDKILTNPEKKQMLRKLVKNLKQREG